jgi:hypothetical protein
MERVLLKEHNYPEWEEYIRDELLARALWGSVQGTTKPPQKPIPKTKTETTPVGSETPESTDSVYMSDFRRYLIQRDTYNDKVGMATSEIRRSLDPSVRRRYADKKYISAPDVLWADIEKDFNRVAKIDANVGFYKLSAIRRADFDSAAAYHSRIVEIATELRNVGTDLPERVLAFYMVQGLPKGDVWLAFRTSLNLSESAGSCQKILGQLQIFECSYAWDRHGVSAYIDTELSTALFAKKGTAKKKGGESAGGTSNSGGASGGGSGKASGGDQDKDSKTIKCFGCGKKGHKKFECRSKHLWKENSDSKDKEKDKKESSKANVVKDQPASTAGMDFLLLSREGGPKADKIRESVSTDRCATTTDWVVDSGATSRIRYRALAAGEHEVIFADEGVVSAAGIGDIGLLLPCGNGSSTRTILRNVPHVPACGKNNLMSVYQFLMVGVKVDYDLDRERGVTLFTKKDRKIVGIGPIRGKSFFMIAESPTSYHVNRLTMHRHRLEERAYAYAANDIMLWHNRLGHLSLRASKKLQSSEGVTGMTVKPSSTDECICEACMLGSDGHDLDLGRRPGDLRLELFVKTRSWSANYSPTWVTVRKLIIPVQGPRGGV